MENEKANVATESSIPVDAEHDGVSWDDIELSEEDLEEASGGTIIISISLKEAWQDLKKGWHDAATNGT